MNKKKIHLWLYRSVSLGWEKILLTSSALNSRQAYFLFLFNSHSLHFCNIWKTVLDTTYISNMSLKSASEFILTYTRTTTNKVIKTELHHCRAQDLFCSISGLVLLSLRPAAMLTGCCGGSCFENQIFCAYNCAICMCTFELKSKQIWVLKRNKIIQWKALCSTRSNETASFGPCLCHGMIAEMEKEETEVTRVNIHLNRMNLISRKK